MESDLCIIGAGAAGITIAREFANGNISVCLLESGTFEPEDRTQSLYDGESTATLIKPPAADYLRTSRLRYFGGTTNHWWGQCLPLDEIDFAHRPWVAHSGWPLTRRQLDQYYTRAFPICQIEPEGYDGRTAGIPPDPLLTIDDSLGFALKRFYFSPPTRFGERYRKELTEAANIRLHLGANVVDIEAHHDGTHIERVRVVTLNSNQFHARARFYVLATGAIENARLLLNSDRIHQRGLGNEHDLVGRFFMEHPWTHYGRMSYWVPRVEPLVSVHDQRRRAAFWPTEETQKRFELLNGSVHAWFRPKGTAVVPEDVARVAYAIDHLLTPEAQSAAATDIAGIFAHVEQSPNPESRVTSTQERDALGQRKIRLDWKLRPFDQQNVQRLVDLFARTLGRHGLGRAQIVVDEADPWMKASVAWHHIGTTRMSADPRQGVVDEHGRVHGVDNLFVAGSSVFPTGSFINPTLTITALALKLAAHLGDRFTA